MFELMGFNVGDKVYNSWEKENGFVIECFEDNCLVTTNGSNKKLWDLCDLELMYSKKCDEFN